MKNSANKLSRFSRVAATATRTFALLIAISVFSAGMAVAQDQRFQIGPVVIRESHHDTSAPVRELAQSPQPNVMPTIIPLQEGIELPTRTAGLDPVVQQNVLPTVNAQLGLSFDGIRDVDGAVPGDPNASVGDTQIVEVVNSSFEVFDKKTGKSILGPAELKSIFKNFGIDGCNGSAFSAVLFDPVVLYDKGAKRWLITVAESDNMFASSTECVAVSTTSDATGSYHRYEFPQDPFLGDYPKFGVWPDAYYASYNLFIPGLPSSPQLCAYDRTSMLSGGAANAICFAPFGPQFTFLPSDLDGTGIATKGEPNFFVELNLLDSSSLDLYKFHVDFTNPNNSKLDGPIRIPVAPFSEACGGKTCIPQKDTSQQLDSVGDRLMFRLAYRKFKDHESLVVNHSVAGKTAAANVRWYEIRNPNGKPVVFQQGTFASGSKSLWMASIGMDKAGDIAFGASESSDSMHPSIVYTGREPTDPKGTMESPAVIFNGKGSQTDVSRWGDYSSISLDPVDDCTFWYTQQYLPFDGSFNWHTRIAAFKFNSCQ